VKAAVVAVVGAFLVIAALTLFMRSPEAEARAERYFNREEVQRFRRHAFERRLIFWSSTVLDLAFLGIVALTGVGSRLAGVGSRLSGDRYLLTALLLGAALFVAQLLLTFPLSVYGGWAHRRAWGLTDRTFASWLGDYSKAVAVSAFLGAVLLVGLYLLLRYAPRYWWALATAGTTLLGVFLAWVAPVVIAPLFNRFTPLAETPHAALGPEVQALVDRARVPVDELLVMDASRQGRHTNAYFSGFGPTRRIVLYDTLLATHTPDEVLSVLGHEIGHWRADHIAKGIALGTLGALVGFLALDLLLRRAASAGWLSNPADPAGLPMILLLSYLGSWLAMPVGNAVSRRFEREADAAALELAGRPEVFIEAEKRLARTNLANVAPTPLSVWLFASHPPVLDRIAMAEAWAAAPTRP
jgi:STE24 endopeptidase